MVQNANNYLVA